MSPMHLDLDTYRKLRSGELDGETSRKLAEHLDGACDECEAFLASLPPDDLDGAVDAALSQLSPVSGATRWLAVAAAVALVGGVSFTALRNRGLGDRGGGEGEKGRPAQVIPARLRFAVVDTGRGQAQLDRGQSGAVVPSGASLAFRVELGRPAYVALLRIGPGESEVVWKQHVARAGAVDVSENGRPAAYPLHGLAGTQRFALIASDHPIADADLAAAARAATGASAGAEDPRWSVMTLDVVEVTVR